MLRRRSEALRHGSRCESDASSAFGNTIASVSSRPSLRPLVIEEGDTIPPQVTAVQDLFKIRLADNDGRREAAGLLVKRRYAWRGSEVGTLHGVNPNRITLSASNRDEVLATIAVGLDSPTGLFVDKLYCDEVDRLRAPGRKVCEFTKLAIEESVRSKPILAALFHIAYIHAHRINLCTDLVIEVNPRHVAFYRRMLEFAPCGMETLDPRIGAPAVLLRLDLTVAERRIAEMGGHLELAATRRSLYPYFFAPHEELAIEKRLRTVR
jgi:hypothetical protein